MYSTYHAHFEFYWLQHNHLLLNCRPIYLLPICWVLICRYTFLLFNWFGAFPVVYDQETKTFNVCPRGLLVTLVQAVFIGLRIYKFLTVLLCGIVKKTAAVSVIVLVTDGLGLLVILLRRIVLVKDTVACYNSLQSEWPADISIRKSYKVILYASIAMILTSFAWDSIERYVWQKQYQTLER